MKITHLQLFTTDLVATRRFYTHQLYLPVVMTTPKSVTFRVGWTDLEFTHTDKPLAPYHFAINVPLYCLEQYQLWFDLPYLTLDQTGNRIAQFPLWKARATYFYDPMGNLIEFIERTDAGFGQTGSYFQGISEIGLAVANVVAAAAWLADELGLLSFTKSQPKPDFNAVGNDYGLFILAQTGRLWLFTSIPASEQDFTIHFTDRFNDQHVVTAASIRQRSTHDTNLDQAAMVSPEIDTNCIVELLYFTGHDVKIN